MNIRKIASLGLAVALQVLPITRVFVASTTASGSSFAIVSTWIAGALALMGGVDAVSGASSLLISPATATTGVAYSGIVQYSGSHASSVKSFELKNNWSGAKSGCNTVYEIAPGLWLTNAATYLARVGGTPTASGTFTFTLKIWSGSGCTGGDSDSRSATITIAGGTTTAPTITTQPVSQTVTAGANASFSVVASGTAPLTYQWKQDGANVAGGTSATLNLTGVTAGQAGSYTVVVGNSAGSVTSSAATLVVNPAVVAPTITTQPVSQTVTAGANVSFSVTASGTAPLTYQWKQDGANVASGTSATLNLTGVTAGQAGSYTVVVGNSAGSVTSSAATLAVNPAVVAPTITTQPVSQTVTAGANVSFSVVANGTAPLTYQWKQDGANVAGGTSATLNLTGVTAGQAGSYTVVVGNSAGSVTSSAATLAVSVAPVAPTITTQPVSQTVAEGGNVSFSVSANGTAPLSYQWRRNGSNLAGATSATLNLTGVTTNQAGSYTVVVGNSAGSVTSSAATLAVSVAPVAPTITTQPVSQTVAEGGNASFSVSANGTAPLSYQWQRNGSNLAGATSATLNLTGVTTNQAGSYTVVVANSVGSITSSAAVLTVALTPVAPTIVGPVSQTVMEGDSVSFSVVASGTAPMSYQWRRNGANVAGATSATLNLTGVTTNQAGSYTVVVNNSVGSVTSSAAVLTVTITPVVPSITSQPVSQTAAEGGNVSFSVSATGDAPLSYQWQRNGSNLAGATSATLNLTGVTTNQAGSYTVVVANSVGSITSSAAVLTVTMSPPVAPSIVNQPVSQTVAEGRNASFSVSANGTAPMSYQWRRNGSNLAGATSATLTLTGVTTNQAGSYTVVVNNSVGSATSSAAVLTVTITPVVPSITSQPVSQTVAEGRNASFSVSANGTAPLSYQWRRNGSNLAGATSATLNLTGVTTNQAGSYTVVVNNSVGSVTSSAAVLTVTITPVVPSITSQPVSQTVAAGGNASFSVSATGDAPLSYQWRRNGSNLAGATSATLNLTGVTTNQAGSYTVVVNNSVGSVTSSVAVLTVTVTPVAPSIVSQPVSRTVTAGANVSFTVGVSGTAPFSYQWRLNGANLAAATSATLNLTSVVTNQSGSYSCVVTNVAGSATSSSASLTVQTAQNHYAAAAGDYNGLFFESDEVRVRSAGSFNLHADEAGNYSGWLQVGYTRHSFSGKLDAKLQATNVIARYEVAPLTIEFRIGEDAEADEVSGRVTDGVWNAPLSGGRPVVNPPSVGDYTLVIPGAVGGDSVPEGDSYATMHVGADGLATMNGTLADGTRFAQSAYVTAQGDWPLYVSLYSAKGVVVSWLHFAGLASSDVSGALVWVKQAGASATSYPAGFTNETTAVGSLYVPPAANGKVLNLSSAEVNFSGGDLGANFNNLVSVNAGSSVVNLSPNPLTLTLVPLGSFTGQVTEPGTGIIHVFGGVVLQKQNTGYGFMSGVQASSRVVLAPAGSGN